MAEITTDQYYPNVTLTITDAQGNPAKVDGVPVWASSDETVLTVQPSLDGMSASIGTVAPGGPARVSVSADPDLSANVGVLTGFTEDITVTQGASTAATTMVLTLGDPADKAPVVNPV